MIFENWERFARETLTGQQARGSSEAISPPISRGRKKENDCDLPYTSIHTNKKYPSFLENEERGRKK